MKILFMAYFIIFPQIFGNYSLHFEKLLKKKMKLSMFHLDTSDLYIIVELNL